MDCNDPSDQQADVPPLRGLLRDYFTDWDDINRFIQEERQGWERRERLLDEMWDRAERRTMPDENTPESSGN